MYTQEAEMVPTKNLPLIINSSVQRLVQTGKGATLVVSNQCDIAMPW